MSRSRLTRLARLLWPPFVRRWLPRSLFGRSLLIIVLPVVLMQAAVTWAFFEAHWDAVSGRLADGLAGDVAWVSEAYVRDPSPQSVERIRQQAEAAMDLSVAVQPGRRLPTEERRALIAALDRSLDRALSERLDRPYWFDTTRYPAYVDIRVQTPRGVLRILAPRDRAYAAQAGAFVMWLGAATILLTGVAVLFIRNQVRAIERLAAAAEAFGRGAEVPSFRPHGAREVRQAAMAFLAMKARIQRHIEQRTTLLASVSHDLRTPLTRLKLELAMAEPDARTEDMKRDIDEMEHMIDEYLAFARGEAGESPVPVRLHELVGEACADAQRAGARIEVQVDPDLEAELRPNAIRRALANLVSNAATHGRRLRVEARRMGDRLEIVVEDDGPGIPPERRADALRPFHRLDESRNQNAKGVGLGLAIARDVARSHGGDLVLDESRLGGLRAVIRLPA